MLLFLTIALPMLGGAAMGLMRFSSAKSRGIYVETIVLATSILTWVLLLTRTDTTYVLCHMNSELALAFRVDGMSCIFAGLVSILWPLASLYGFEYMQHEERPNTFFSYYTMSYAVTLAVAFSANLFSLYVFYECLTLITLPLVIHKKDTMSIRAGRKYLTFSISGAALAFIALVFIIYYGTTTDFVLGGVLDAEKTFYETQNANPLRGLYPLSIAATEAVEEARLAVRDFLHAKSSQEIIFTRNTTEALNLVAYSYGLSHVHTGDEVVVSILEHHSNLLPWQMVCRQTGATLKFIDCEMDGRLDLNKVSGIITEKTKIVAVTHVSNVIGRVNPIREIADMAHRVGAVIVVDGAQSTPHIPVDVQALDADFLAFSGHKVFGPMGIGALYGKRRLLEKMPPFLSGGEMIESVTRTGATYAELPYKFEAGTGNAAGTVGLHAAIRYMQSVGFDTMHERETALVARMMAGMADMPFIHVLGSGNPEEHSGIVTFTVDGVHPHDVSEILAADGACIRAGHHCAQPLLKHLGYSSTVRASCAFYNTPDEVDRLLDSLKTIRERMGYGKQELL